MGRNDPDPPGIARLGRDWNNGVGEAWLRHCTAFGGSWIDCIRTRSGAGDASGRIDKLAVWRRRRRQRLGSAIANLRWIAVSEGAKDSH